MVDLAEIQTFVFCEGAAGGVIGAFLILAASALNFEVGLTVEDWGRRILFIFSGGLAGALLDYNREIELFYGAVVGAGWPYFAISLKKGAEVIFKGVKRHGGVAAREFMKSVLTSMAQEQAGAGRAEGANGTP